MGTATLEGQVRKSFSREAGFWLGALLTIWVPAILGCLSFASFFIFVGFLAWLLEKRRFSAAIVLTFATPMSVIFFLAVEGYLTGTTGLCFVGLPNTNGCNLDRELRCERLSGGCIVMGNEWLTNDLHNAVVYLMTRHFGPMPGSYTGPYPTESQAIAAMQAGTVVPFASFQRDQFQIGQDLIRLDQGVGARLLQRLHRYEVEYPGLPEITAVIWQEECIIVRIPVQPQMGSTGESAAIALFSRSMGRPFAFYGEGGYGHNHAPVHWKRRPDESVQLAM